MRTPELGQATFLDELGLQVDKLEKRLLKDRVFSQLTVWTEMISSVWQDAIRERDDAIAAVRKREDDIYRQVMLLELDFDKGRSASIANRIGLIKGMLACGMLALCLVSTFSIDDSDNARRAKTRIRVREEIAA